MRCRFRVLILACAPLAVLVACAEEGVVETTEVSMTSDHTFEPPLVGGDLAGKEITFVNDSDEPHTVTAYEESLPEGADYFSSGGFDSEQAAREGVSQALIPPGGEFTLTLDQPGTYQYFCIPHEDHGMKGEIQL